MSESPTILDATCGGKSIWLDEHVQNDATIFVDRRQEEPGFHGQPGRTYDVDPSIIADNRQLPFSDSTFSLIIFDPPYKKSKTGMKQLSGYTSKKYGSLHAETWQDDLQRAVDELFRVLNDTGTLVFKFANVATDWEDVLDTLPVTPMFGTTTKKKSTYQTRWFTLHATQYDR